MLRFRDFLLLEYNEDKNWANHGAKISERLHSQGVESNHREFWHKQIEDHDPTPNKEYAGWISQKYATGGIRHHEDIGSRVGPALETYHKNKLKKTLETHGVSKDIGSHKTIKDLEDSVAKLPKIKEKSKDVSDSEVTKHDEEHWKVYTPHTKAASQKYGAGTRWCTASKQGNMFFEYNSDGPMHIYVPKKPKYPGEKYQGHRESFGFMDETDAPAKESEVFKDRPSPHNQKHGVTPEHITNILKNTNSYYITRKHAINHSSATSEHVSMALNDPESVVRRYAASSPNATSKHIFKALNDRVASVRRAALEGPNVTPEHISHALDGDCEFTRECAMEHPAATKEHIDKGLNDPAEFVRAEAAYHKNATPEQITKGLNDPTSFVRQRALRNPNVTEEHYKIALNSGDKHLARTARLELAKRKNK